VRGQIRVWFDVPVYLFLGAFVLGLAFTVTRDYPWTLVIPSTLIAGAVGLGVGSLVNPTLTNAFFTGAGYFVQSKVVTTIAEDQVLRRADFAGMRRTYRSLSGGNWRNALRKSVKVRHVLAVLGIVFLVLLPNIWWAVDASIPFELKSQYDKQLAALLPSFLRSPGYSASSNSPFYFGAFGYSIPKPTEYYPAAWRWLATQDTDRPAELRPAFLSWWDYGFEAVDRGVHPTVADNFQNGFALAGQFITAQNETEAISLLVIRLLEGDMKLHRPNFSPAVAATLSGAGLPVDVFQSVILHPADYISLVLSDPVRYGAWAQDMQPQNAEYVFLTHLLARQLDLAGAVSLYHSALYNSMFTRSCVGYAPADLGSNDTGIPGFDQALQAYPPAPAWNLTHFRVVYRSSYYNPFPDPANHTDAWRAMNYDEALRFQANITAGTLKGVVDLGTTTAVANGVVLLRYYDGAIVNGTVTAGSTPLPGVRITVTDELGTPHYLTTTDASGRYRAVVPFGDITITASSGSLTRTTLIGTRTLASAKVHVTVQQAMRSPVDANGDGVPDWLMTLALQATPADWHG